MEKRRRKSLARVEQPPRHQLALPSHELDRPVRPDAEVKADLYRLLMEQMLDQSRRWSLPLDKL